MVNFMSFNCTGAIDDVKHDYIADILNVNDIDIAILQETWLSPERECLLSSIHSNYMYCAKSGMDSRSDILLGRPYGGVAILWKRSLAKSISKVNCSNKRICAASITLNCGYVLLLINLYMPCDNRSLNHVDPEYIDCINDVQTLMNDHSPQMIRVGGDLNTDPSRKNAHSRYLEQFCLQNGLEFSWKSGLAKPAKTFVNNSEGSSVIDHFICSHNLYDNISNVVAIDDAVNQSFHKPIVMSVCIDDLPRLKVNSKISKKTILWESADVYDIDKYQGE
jgi:exonuclease III